MIAFIIVLLNYVQLKAYVLTMTHHGKILSVMQALFDRVYYPQNQFSPT